MWEGPFCFPYSHSLLLILPVTGSSAHRVGAPDRNRFGSFQWIPAHRQREKRVFVGAFLAAFAMEVISVSVLHRPSCRVIFFSYAH